MPLSKPGVDPMEIERLIGEVAKRHNALLGRDDPIFMVVTLNELIIARALEQVQAAVEASQDQISAGTAQQIATAKTVAASLITSAADYVAGQVRAATADAAQQIQLAAAEELRGARLAAKSAQKAGSTAALAAGVAIAAAAIVATLATFSPWLDTRPLSIADCRLPCRCRPPAMIVSPSALPGTRSISPHLGGCACAGCVTPFGASFGHKPLA